MEYILITTDELTLNDHDMKVNKDTVLECDDKLANKILANRYGKKVKLISLIDDEETPEESTEEPTTDLSKLTNKQLMDMLDEMEIEYDKNAVKNDLIALIKGGKK